MVEHIQIGVCGECSINNNTLAIHNFELSWISDKYKGLLNFYYSIYNIFYRIVSNIVYYKKYTFKIKIIFGIDFKGKYLILF